MVFFENCYKKRKKKKDLEICVFECKDGRYAQEWKRYMHDYKTFSLQ